MCRVCLKQDGAHYLQVVGHDRWRRPILYSCLALPMNRQVEDNRRHMIATFEQVWLPYLGLAMPCRMQAPVCCFHTPGHRWRCPLLCASDSGTDAYTFTHQYWPCAFLQ